MRRPFLLLLALFAAGWVMAERAGRRADFARFIAKPEFRSRVARARRLRNEKRERVGA